MTVFNVDWIRWQRLRDDLWADRSRGESSAYGIGTALVVIGCALMTAFIGYFVIDVPTTADMETGFAVIDVKAAHMGMAVVGILMAVVGGKLRTSAKVHSAKEFGGGFDGPDRFDLSYSWPWFAYVYHIYAVKPLASAMGI